MRFMKSAMVATAALTNSANAWWSTGHLLVANIAHKLLEADQPDVITETNAILARLQKSDPSWTEKEGDHPFIECTTFADDIKHKGGDYQSGWHFIDNPYMDEGGPISKYNFTFDTHNVTEAISAIALWFNEGEGYENTYEYTQVMDHRYGSATALDAQSTAMRLLMHYCGDIHQPLHATSRVDSHYEQGDRGGNDVSLPSIDGAKNLHAVWDAVVYTEAQDYDLPFTSDDWTTFDKLTDDLIAKIDVSDVKDLASLDPVVWANDSFKIAQDFVYNGVVEGKALTDDYDAAGAALAEKQIVIGGHRLANLLKSLKITHTQRPSLGFLQK